MTRRLTVAGCSAVTLGILGSCGLCLLMTSIFFTSDEGTGNAVIPTSGALLLAGPEPMSVPLVIRYNLPFVHAMVNSEGPFLFLLDTGSASSSVSRKLAKKFDLRPQAGLERVLTDASGTRKSHGICKVDLVSIDGVDATGVWVVVQDFAPFQATTEPAMQGILGFDLFRSVLMTIDYEQERLVLRTCALDVPDSAEVMPYELTRGTPKVRLTICDKESEFLLDSGSNGSIQVPSDLARLLPFGNERFSQESILSRHGRAGSITARLDQPLAIGGIVIERPLISWMEGHENAPSLIGGQILRYFAVTFDAATTSVHLERRVQGPLRQNGIRHTGLTYGLSNNGLRIHQIVPGSSASQLDLQSGDHVVAIDEREVRLDGQGFGPWDLRSLVEEQDEVLHRILRGDSEFTVAVPVSTALP